MYLNSGVLAKRPRSDTDSWLRRLPVQLVSLLHVVVRYPRPLLQCAQPACVPGRQLARSPSSSAP